MKYLTGVGPSIWKAPIDRKSHMLSEVRIAFNCYNYNYKSPPSATEPVPTLPEGLGRSWRLREADRIVHNLCINWQ